MIEIHGENGKIGEVSLKGGKVAGSTPAVQDVAEHMVRKHGSPQKAFRAIATMNDGYIWAQSPGKVPATVQQHASTRDDLAAVIELSARTAQLEVTPAPRGKPGGPGLYDVKNNMHSPYMQQVVKALIEKRGMDPHRAYAVAWGALRKWSRGGGKVHPEVRAAAAGGLALEKVAEARAHSHARSWDQVSRDIELATVLEFFNPAEARVPGGQAGGGQFTTGGGSGQSKSQPAKQGKAKVTAVAKGPAPAKRAAPAATGAGQPMTAHQQHLAHVAHVAHELNVSTAKAKLLVTAQDDRQQAAALTRKRDALAKALASASGKTSSGQAGATTSANATTKTTAPAAPASTAAPAAKTPAKTAAASASTSKTAGNATAVKAQITALDTQITNLLAQAKQAEAQAAKLK